MFLSNIAISRPVFTTMVIIGIIIFGIVSYTNLGIDRDPDVDIPYLTITTVYPGADPETVETEIIDRIEEELMTLQGIKMIESQALENMGLVVLEYELNVDIDIAAQDARARLDSIQRDLPEDAERPVVEKLDIGDIPIMSLAVSADMPLSNLTTFVDDFIKPKVESIEGVGSVKVVGGREREIHVRLNPELMKARNISVEEVIGYLQMSNVEIPGGRIETGTRELVVKTKGRIPDVENFGNLVLRSSPDSIVRLKDIANVSDTIEEKRSLARLDGEDSIGLVVRKKSGANTVRVAEHIEEAVHDLQGTLPPGIQINIPSDESLFIRGSFEALLHHLMYGSLWATVIVFFFLRSPRSTLICAVAIPTSIIGTFIFMQAMGFTLNMVSMLGLSSCVGMLIDDAIVVLENIYRHMEEGEGQIEAARDATAEIGLAVMATTFSIVAVFVPVAYTYGMIGRFMYEFGMTVSFAVLISLFVSFTLTPMLCSKFLVATQNRGWFYKTMESLFVRLENSYKKLLARALRWKPLTILLAVAIFIFSIWLAQFVPFEFFPSMDEEMYSVTVETPPGSPINVIEEKIEEAEDRLKQFPEIKTIFSTVGSGSIPDVTEGNLQIALIPRGDREKHQNQIMAKTRRILKDIPGAEFSVGQSGGFGHGGDIEVVLLGNDLDEMYEYATVLTDAWAKEPGFVDINISYEAGKPEVRVLTNRERASKMGLNVAGIATAINALVSGENVITTFKEGGHDYDLKVRLQEPYRDNPGDLLSIPLRSATGQIIDLGSVASIQQGSGPSQINHRDGQRSISIWANLEGVPLGPAKDKTTELMKGMLPPEITYTFGGMTEMMEESFASLFFSMFLAIILIYMILCSQYEHLVHPLSIMLSLPLSMIGALGLLFLTNSAISIITMIGIIMLMGVVTKNAILLVDYTNTLRKRGLAKDEAILQAGPVRLRPILMTTFATIFGLLPIAFSTGAGAEMQSPMAICIIGGLTTSTLLTLVVVPVVYSVLDSATNFFTRSRRKSA